MASSSTAANCKIVSCLTWVCRSISTFWVGAAGAGDGAAAGICEGGAVAVWVTGGGGGGVFGAGACATGVGAGVCATGAVGVGAGAGL